MRIVISARLRASATGLAALLLPILTQADGKLDAAIFDLHYLAEVASYCGTADRAAQQGFQKRLKQLLAGQDMDRKHFQTIRGNAWQAGHEEWANRGLGGYRAWCRTDGKAAAETLGGYR